MKVTVCIGSSCHLKGSREVVERLQALVAREGLEGKVELGGTFCVGNCQNGVCAEVEGKAFSVTPQTTDAFFEEEILAKLRAQGFAPQILSAQRG